jgi:hypothetical protein
MDSINKFCCKLDTLFFTWRGCMPVEYCVELICSEHLMIPIAVWFTSLIGIWRREGGEGRWGESKRERERPCMWVWMCDLHTVKWFESGWCGLCYLYHVLYEPCRSWLDIVILNLTFKVQSMLGGDGRTWQLGDCKVLEYILWHPCKGWRSILLVGSNLCHFTCSIFAKSVL